MWWLLKKPVVVWLKSEAITFFFSLVQVPPRAVVDPSEVMVVEMEMVVMVVMVVLVLEALDQDIPDPWYPPCRTL